MKQTSISVKLATYSRQER